MFLIDRNNLTICHIANPATGKPYCGQVVDVIATAIERQDMHLCAACEFTRNQELKLREEQINKELGYD